jgi:hypothetical protein
MSALKTETPLIPESLAQFYRRMAKAWRSPAPPDAVAIAKLSRVVELHHRVAATIQIAVERSDPGGQEQLRELCSEQTRLAHAVGELVTELGGSPPRPEESSLDLPRDPRAMSYARDQAELMGFVHEDLDYVAAAHLDLASFSEIPIAMRQRLEALCRRENLDSFSSPGPALRRSGGHASSIQQSWSGAPREAFLRPVRTEKKVME